MIENLIRGYIEARLIALRAARERYLEGARPSSPQPGRDAAPSLLLATKAAIAELEQVLEVMLALAIDRQLDTPFAGDSMLAELAERAGIGVADLERLVASNKNEGRS